MTRVFNILITQEDINEGRKLHPYNCPIAIAAKKLLHSETISVSPTFLRFRKNNLFIECILSKNAIDFINKFDTGRKVSPCMVSIQIPDDEHYEGIFSPRIMSLSESSCVLPEYASESQANASRKDAAKQLELAGMREFPS